MLEGVTKKKNSSLMRIFASRKLWFLKVLVLHLLFNRTSSSFQGLVIAGIGDINRPVESVSLRQVGALAATGFIWSRYSLVIIPKNWSLFSVNMFVGLTNMYQVVRVLIYQQNLAKEESQKAIEAK